MILFLRSSQSTVQFKNISEVARQIRLLPIKSQYFSAAPGIVCMYNMIGDADIPHLLIFRTVSY